MSAPARELVLTSFGDPYDPWTWSGTPHHILRALERRGIRVHGIDYTQSRPGVAPRPGRLSRLARRALRVAPRPPLDERGADSRACAATYVADQARLQGCPTVLHTGTFDLPSTDPDPSQVHYLFCDATWHLAVTEATSTARFEASYIEDADRLERASYQQMSHIFPIARHVAVSLTEHYGVDPARVTPVGTGLNRIAPYEGAKDYECGPVLTVARHKFEDKGGRLLLDAFQIARRARPELHLFVVGTESNASFVGDAENVTVTGFVSDEQLQRLFESAALFALPALYEPWGLVYLEALACKTPILGLARNALPEITNNGRYGFLVDEPTPLAIANALLDALSQPRRLRDMGAAGQAHCLRTYTWDLVAERIATRIFGP